METPTVAEYVAAGMDEQSAVAMRQADLAFEGAIQTMRANGWRVKSRLPRSKGQEAKWHVAGFRPVLLREGRLRLALLGPWGLPPTPAAEAALSA